jgi:aryl-alcohol dehydrogenase-like predicted oxidoreductase
MGVQESKIITKIPAFASDCRDHDQVCSSIVNQTLGKLKISRLHGVLLHRPEQLFSKSGSDIYDAMAKLKADGSTELIGCSVYDVTELKEIRQNFEFDIYQIPYNVLDRRFSENGVMKQLQSEGTKIYTRSVFLQGLLLMERKDRPDWLKIHSKALNEWTEFVHDSGRLAIELCIDFVFKNPDITGVVVGVDSVRQLNEIYEYVNKPIIDFGFTPSQIDQVLCDPRRWKN